MKSDARPFSDGIDHAPPLEITHGASNLRIMTLVLWAAVALALAAPTINSGVFDAMSTDDAMRLVEVRDPWPDKAGST